MKNYVVSVLAALTMGAIVAAPVAFAQTKMSSHVTKPTTKPKSKVQKATITINEGYSPNSILVEAGKPVILTFVRKSAEGCDGDLLIPSLKVQRSLKQNEKTVVAFTPKKAGTIPFSCGMNMYKGRILVK